MTKLLWPSPPGAGAVSPIGPGDNHWMGSQQDKVASEGTSNGTTAISEKAATPDTIRQGSLGMLPLGGKDKEKLSLDMPALPITVPVDQIIIRIEVRDTGMGIKRKDIRDAKLFSPYVQVIESKLWMMMAQSIYRQRLVVTKVGKGPDWALRWSEEL